MDVHWDDGQAYRTYTARSVAADKSLYGQAHTLTQTELLLLTWGLTQPLFETDTTWHLPLVAAACVYVFEYSGSACK